jgi:hypothetical protein
MTYYDDSYEHYLVSVLHPTWNNTIERYCLGIDREDPLVQGLSFIEWALPKNRNRILSLLCEDWLTDGCIVVGVEEISGAVQWGKVE